MGREEHHGAATSDAITERQELFRYTDLNHPLIALLFTDSSLQQILPGETAATCD